MAERAVPPAGELPPLRRNREFLLLWTGAGMALLGTRVSGIAYPLLVLWSTGSASSAGLVGFAVAVMSGRLWIPHLMAAAFVESSLTIFYVLAERGGIRNLVPAGQRDEPAGLGRQLGGNVQALCEPNGLPIWTSDVEPGGVVDIQAARTHVLPAVHPYAATIPVLADPGYQGAGHGVIVPFKQPTDGNVPAVGNRTHNALQRSLRCLGERGFALLTERWTALQHTTLSPSRIGDPVRSAHVLTIFEHRRIS